jgi:very-short-patch-repair endonuclease
MWKRTACARRSTRLCAFSSVRPKSSGAGSQKSAAEGARECGCSNELLVDAGGHTMLERDFLRLMREAGLPRPRTQVIFRDGQRTAARVDFLFPEFMLVVEVSGRLGHSSPAERARDAQRRNELQDIGLRVYEFTWEQVTKRPGWVQEQMRRLLR